MADIYKSQLLLILLLRFFVVDTDADVAPPIDADDAAVIIDDAWVELEALTLAVLL